MATSNRFPKNPEREVGDGNSENANLNYDDEKTSKARLQEYTSSTKMGLLFAVMFVILLVHGEMGQSLSNAGTTVSKISNGNRNAAHYELYPFLVDSDAVTKSLSKQTGIPDAQILSKPTLPGFPVIDDMEDCSLAYKPSDPPRKDPSNWRPMFWIPSYSGSGSANPTGKGDLLKDIIEYLFVGDGGNEGGYIKPVKNFHMSMRNRLKRCKGISETIACSSGHPVVPTKPEDQTADYHPETILSIRNPATVIPIMFAYKNMKYHGGEKQAKEEGWRNLRNEWFENSFDDWINQIKFWRGADNGSFYFTKVYVPFEDLVTTDALKGTAMIKKISDTLSGRDTANTKNDGFFETTTSEKDYKCIWYRIAKQEWEREKTIIGDYIPAYTKDQKDKMVRGLKAFAEEVESDSFEGDQDTALVSLLRRYAYQIEQYLRLE